MKDYYALNFTAQLDDPGTRKIWEVVDGYIYFDRLEALPKFVVNACGDEFLQMDDDHYVGHTTQPTCTLQFDRIAFFTRLLPPSVHFG